MKCLNANYCFNTHAQKIKPLVKLYFNKVVPPNTCYSVVNCPINH